MKESKTVLLIDDEIALRDIVKIALESQGYTVVEAGNGLEGIEKLRTVKPHLIILDMNMPKMGGFEFYKSICDGDGRPPYPIMVLTAHAHLEKLFKEIEIDGFMTKPFEIDQLLMEVNMIVLKKLKAEKQPAKSASKHVLGALNVCLVESNPDLQEAITNALTDGGYNVHCCENGVEAIEYIFSQVPEAAAISLKLPDISGDMVIQRLKNLAKTENVKFVLYLQEVAEKTIVSYKISQKKGVDRFLDSDKPADILKGLNEVLAIKKALPRN